MGERRTWSWRAVAMVWALVCVAGARGQNLLEDPSFEQPKDRDRWGLVFAKWGGNIYDPPAFFEASTVAHSGKYSCCMVGDLRCKIRVYSNEVKLAPGRYRVKLFVRGMDIGKGTWNLSMDFSCGFDDKFMPIAKSGTFGWTPLTYVFEMKPQQANKPFRLFMGLWGGGRLWVDDASLEKVDGSVALTPQPMLGKEEAPFGPPAALGAAAVHCPTCGYLNSADGKACYACGHDLPGAAQVSTAPPVKVITDFEDGSTKPFSGGQYVADGTLGGKGAVQLSKGAILLESPQDWSQYDYFRFDTFNPSEKPVTIYIEIRDKQTRDYWTRVNLNSVVPPGKSTLSFRTDLYVGEKSRPGRPLARNQITHLFISTEQGPILVDNVRLERLDTKGLRFDGLLALDFGPIDSPVMEGFTQGLMTTVYSPARGYGWQNAQFWRAFNVLQPEALCQDFVTPTGGSFRVDLPNGRYHVMMNIDSPGGFWGEPQVYPARQVLANGRAVVDEKMDYEGFLKKYFRNAGREDLPGVDTFKEYVERMFDVKQFDVDVRDGKLELGFRGESWANCLSWLVIYPADKAQQGQKFMQWVTAQRKSQFNEEYKQIEPKKSPAPAEGYVLFSRPMALPVQAYDGPAAGEQITAEGLSLTVAPGEESPITLAVQPGADLGTIDLAVSEFRNEKGQTLDASAFKPGWLDYRLTRVTAEGSVYTAAPRYWHPTPAPSAPKVTRRFWVRVKPAATAAPGTYRGEFTVKPQNGPAKAVAVTIRVLAFKLDPITDVAVGPWGSGIGLPWEGSDPRTRAWNWSMFEKALDTLSEGGCSSFSGRPTIHVSAKNGKITLDTAQADREMQLIKAKGFRQLISSYGAGASMGYQTYGVYNGSDVDAARQAGFADMESFLAAIYGAIDQHAKEAGWLPIAWNLCDEPLGDSIPGAVANAKAHRAIAGGLAMQTFMGATSMEGNDPKNPHYELARALPMPSLNGHDEASLKMLQEAGNRFSFYNGGNRWTYGRYMKMLVVKHQLALRLTWHYNVVAGDPYYALDCREDDYCWYNTDANQTLVPSIAYLSQIMPGLNDYRYLSTLQRLVTEKPDHANTPAARKVLEKMLDLKAGADRRPAGAKDDETPGVEPYASDRAEVIGAIEAMLK